MASYRSFCVTVRPLHGISDITVEAFQKWFNKLDYVAAVLEMNSEARHLHAQMWFSEGKFRGDISKQCQRICERTIDDFDSSQLKVMRAGIKIAYSDWYLDYLIDNDNKEKPNILIQKVPEKTLEYYPTEEEQERVRGQVNATDPFFFSAKADFEDWYNTHIWDAFQPTYPSDTTKMDIAKFLHDAQHKTCSMKVIRNKRDAVSLVNTLYAHVTGKFDEDWYFHKNKADKKSDDIIEFIKENYNNNN